MTLLHIEVLSIKYQPHTIAFLNIFCKNNMMVLIKNSSQIQSNYKFVSEGIHVELLIDKVDAQLIVSFHNTEKESDINAHLFQDLKSTF